ncbi:MAG TPA: single-stranded-DNA-specific exonuclease RecJ [Syntrophaceae bacterium]|nr:single-stranded-DNA-specific exonuclease RecJ [Syntrophaceae bacterium]
MEKEWKICTPHQDKVQELASQLNIHPLIIQVLFNRGIEEKDSIHKFLYPSLKDLHSPFHMKDMDKAVDRVIKAILNREGIVIYGDYDADGVTSTALLLDFLQGLGGNVSYYIPNRLEEGYGLNRKALDQIARSGTRLVITVDCGITNIQEIEYARGLGMDTIITDHHETPVDLPPALAILNPKQPGCTFPFKELAGVGVVFNLIIALRARLREMGFWKDIPVPNLKNYLDIVALGTIADMVPLVDENRIFVKIGLTLLTKGSRPGIAALKNVSGLEMKEIEASDVGFKLAPRINAGGRIGVANDGVELLIAKDRDTARPFAERLNQNNHQRQRMEEQILSDVLRHIDMDSSLLQRKSLVLASSKWHPGVIGIVASRLVEQYLRPVILISLIEGIGKGSCRSIKEFNLYEGLKSCRHLLEGFGGHKYAAGMTLLEGNITEFYRFFEATVRESLPDRELYPKMEIDSMVNLDDLTETFTEHLCLLPPFGIANPEPIFCTSGLNITDIQVVGEKHLKFKAFQGTTPFEVIGFNMGHYYSSLNSSIQIAFVPQVNMWQEKRSLRLKLKDIKIN